MPRSPALPGSGQCESSGFLIWWCGGGLKGDDSFPSTPSLLLVFECVAKSPSWEKTYEESAPIKDGELHDCTKGGGKNGEGVVKRSSVIQGEGEAGGGGRKKEKSRTEPTECITNIHPFPQCPEPGLNPQQCRSTRAVLCNPIITAPASHRVASDLPNALNKSANARSWTFLPRIDSARCSQSLTSLPARLGP